MGKWAIQRDFPAYDSTLKGLKGLKTDLRDNSNRLFKALFGGQHFKAYFRGYLKRDKINKAKQGKNGYLQGRAIDFQ